MFSVVFISAIFLAPKVYAFEKQEMVFSVDGEQKTEVLFSYTGKLVRPPMDLLKDGIVKDVELGEFRRFFYTMYKNNKNGDKKDILSVWNPSERGQVEAGMDKESLNGNKSRFLAITAMKLKLIIKYADYYICYVANTFNGDRQYVMKFSLVKTDNKLYLTNKLNGDYFYDFISHYLDWENYVPN